MSRKAGLCFLVLGLFYISPHASLYAVPPALVQDPFRHGYNNWIDTFVGAPAANDPPGWRYHFENGTLMEPSDGRAGDGGTNDGKYTPYLLVQNGFTAPTNYVVNARFYDSDDDGLGIVFGYQNNSNYFRLGLRAQATGNLGFSNGITVQRVSGGVVTQLNPNGTGAGNPLLPTIAMVDNHLPIDVRLAVTGTSWAVSSPGINGGATFVSGSNASLAPGKIGLLSWGQRRRDGDITRPPWGLEVDSISVTDPGGSPLFSEPFDTVSPVQWRKSLMTNSLGVRVDDSADSAVRGSFGLQFATASINDSSDGYQYATNFRPNIDFLGPSIVVDEPGSENFTDYEMRFRLENADDDGVGALVRVQNDNTFYRINFASQPMLPSPFSSQPYLRAPGGLSVQKSVNGTWSELYRDNQSNPLFTYQPDHPFDVKIQAVGNSLVVEVVTEGGTTIHYPTIIDFSNPLLHGTVGLTSWANGTSNSGAIWSAYGGVEGAPLLTSLVPEPGAAILIGMAALVCGACARGRHAQGATAGPPRPV